MEIRSLELEHVKSYERERIIFGGGTNAICGPNGAGKSTVIEALGYALFDHVPCRPISNLVREGEKTASITVTLTANDEREYQVVRRCGGANQYYVYDPELGGKIAEGSKDVLAWLREQFGVDETVDLPALFHDAVGVPQGLLTAAFLEAPRVRKGVFDPLLRVEEYGEAFNNLLDARRALDERAHAAQTLIAGLQAEARDLPDLEDRAALLAEQLGRCRSQMAELEAELAALSARKQELEIARNRLQELAAQVSRLDERITGLSAREQEACRAVEAAEAARRTLAECEGAHRAYLAAQEALRTLQARSDERAHLQQTLADARLQGGLANERLQRAEHDLARAEAAAEEAAQLRPKVEEQARLEAALQDAADRARRWEAATAILARERARLADLEARLQKVVSGLEEAALLEAERGAQRQRLEALATGLEGLRTAQAQCQAALDHLEEQSDALARVASAQCPVCEGELSEARRSELVARNARQAALYREQLGELAARQAEAEAERQAIASSLQALEKRLTRLPRPAERDALQAECTAQRDLVRAAERESASLADAQPQVTALQAQLAALNDPRRIYQRAMDAARDQAALARRVEEERAHARVWETRLLELQARLATYAGLDGELAAVQDALAQHESAHHRYLQHEREARAWSERLALRDRVQADLAQAREERSRLAQQLAEASSAFDQDEYTRVASACQRAGEAQSRLAATLEIQTTQLQEAQARIAHLRQVVTRLQEAEEELGTWRELAHLLDYLRRILKDAGPQVTRALVETISHEAARLYSDITGDQTSRLHWSEDYEVSLEHKSFRRTYQQLSGGEQMAAALAVRLALLREVSGIRIAFFDEPTSNLDETRRDNLAEQILAVGGFAQLFVVSHDDTFERATDHIVRIAKEDGASRVVP